MVHFVERQRRCRPHHRPRRQAAGRGRRGDLRRLPGESGAAGLHQEGCEIHDSAKLTLEEVIALIEKAEAEGKTTVRLHTGIPASMVRCGSSSTSWKSGTLSTMSAPRKRLLRRSVRAAGGVHPARCEPDRHHHPCPAAPRCRAGVHSLAGGPSGHHGAVSQHLTDRTAASRAAAEAIPLTPGGGGL